ncbi:MAG: hypothetical protein AAGA81_14095 [Acidobacteriota bacterium]
MFGWELVTEVDANNPDLGDLKIDGTHFARLPSLGDRVAQSVRVALQWWLGEWSFDTSEGTPYIEQLFGKGISDATVRSVLRRRIEQVDGVRRVRKMTITRDASSRRTTVDVEIETTEAEIVSVSDVGVG